MSATAPYYPWATEPQAGRSPCGWWRPNYNDGTKRRLYGGTYIVSLGRIRVRDDDVLWCANLGAVVDDFGTLVPVEPRR